jgi:hypothetical protein
LERVGTPRAIGNLRELAKGNCGSVVAERAAAAALRRLDKLDK